MGAPEYNENVVLAVPNASVTDIDQLDSLPSANLLDVHWDEDHGRAVITYGGSAESNLRSCLAFVTWAVDGLRLVERRGVHPRFGVIDVLPLVPYPSEEAAQRVAVDLAAFIESDLAVPVHLYERAHRNRRSLPELRRYLRSSPHEAHPTAGVVCLGVRDPLVAFNVNFRGNITSTRRVAREARSSEVRTLGFELPSRGLSQVSMNLIAPERVGPRAAFERVVPLAHDLELVDCEVVGLVPHPTLAELEGLPLRKPVRSIEQALAERGLLT